MESRAAWTTSWIADSGEALEAVAASVAMLDVSADPLRDLVDACLDGLADVARQEARTAARKVRLVAEYARAARALVPPAASPPERAAHEMALVAELACVLTVSERASAALLAESRALTTALPLTLNALGAGSISWQHARIIVDETTGLDPAGAAALEAHFLDPGAPGPARGCPAGDLVASRFRAKARSWRERHHPAGIEDRHSRSAADRRIEYTPDRDGMAWLSAYLPAGTAAGIWERTTAAARALQGPREARTLAQLRADTAATWLLTSPGTTGGSVGAGDGGGGTPARSGAGGGVPSPRAQVLITVPVLSLLGATDEPATLDGYGPIPPSMARRLITDGADSFYRVLTDPRDGAPLEIGRSSYRLTKAQRQWLRLRDGKCPSPAAATTPWTTRQTTSWPGPTEAPPASPTSDNPAPNTTASNTAQPGNPPPRAKTPHQAGSPQHDGTTPANNRTGNHPTYRSSSLRRTPSPTKDSSQIPDWDCPRTPSRTGMPSRSGTISPPMTRSIRTGLRRWKPCRKKACSNRSDRP